MCAWKHDSNRTSAPVWSGPLAPATLTENPIRKFPPISSGQGGRRVGATLRNPGSLKAPPAIRIAQLSTGASRWSSPGRPRVAGGRVPGVVMACVEDHALPKALETCHTTPKNWSKNCVFNVRHVQLRAFSRAVHAQFGSVFMRWGAGNRMVCIATHAHTGWRVLGDRDRSSGSPCPFQSLRDVSHDLAKPF